MQQNLIHWPLLLTYLVSVPMQSWASIDSAPSASATFWIVLDVIEQCSIFKLYSARKQEHLLT